MELASLGPFMESRFSASQNLSLQTTATPHMLLCSSNYQNKYLDTQNNTVLFRISNSPRDLLCLSIGTTFPSQGAGEHHAWLLCSPSVKHPQNSLPATPPTRTQKYFLPHTAPRGLPPPSSASPTSTIRASLMQLSPDELLRNPQDTHWRDPCSRKSSAAIAEAHLHKETCQILGRLK